MSDASREQTPAIVSTSVSDTQGRSELFAFPLATDGEPLRGGIAMSNSPLGYQSRSPMSRTFSRSSSGYFSVDSDSVPGSPLMPNISEAHGRHNDEVWFAHVSHPPAQMAAPGAMRPEEMLVARELRRIGDEFNRLYFQEEAVDNFVIPNERAIVVWMNGFIGRLMQLFLRRR